MTRIPDRWEAYSSYGEPIADRFIPLKVPLSKKFGTVRPEQCFTPTDAMALLPLGLVVDLTNTTRYYDPNEFFDGGVEHVKLKVEGKMVPNDTIVRRFMQIVDDFYRRRDRDKGKFIGVHCTHGLNRTGYLICAYLIQRLGYRARDSIELFNARRGHEMERENYLERLYKMEGSRLAGQSESFHRHSRLPVRSSSGHRDRDCRNDSNSRSPRRSDSRSPRRSVSEQRQQDRLVGQSESFHRHSRLPGRSSSSHRDRDGRNYSSGSRSSRQSVSEHRQPDWTTHQPLLQPPDRNRQNRRVGLARHSTTVHPYSSRCRVRPAERKSENVL